jgi:S1-C subfamily serine protease
MQAETSENPSNSPELGQERLQGRMLRVGARLKSLLPFAGGILAAFLGLVLYNALNPPTPPLTENEVNQAVAQAMASATPAPAYSAQVFQYIQPSLVLIQSKMQDAEGETGDVYGSGVVVSAEGDILTALHVVDGAESIQVLFADGTQSAAFVAATQPENDIAVLVPEQLPALLVPAVLGNPNAMHVGDEAFTVGNPFGLYGSMSAGVVSGFNRSFQVAESEQVIEGLIQIDTAVNPGNSGGPLLNRQGHVVGIVIGILNPTEQEFFIGIGFAVPITTAGGAAGTPQY